jgi:hypothetical protein
LQLKRTILLLLAIVGLFGSLYSISNLKDDVQSPVWGLQIKKTGTSAFFASLAKDRLKKSEADKDQCKRHKKSLVSKAFALATYFVQDKFPWDLSHQFIWINYTIVQKTISRAFLRGPPSAC